MGLIIGPRGKTQKYIYYKDRSMEAETGCRINIRGKGCTNGKKLRTDIPANYLDDELHVLIQGDTQESVDKAAEMIEKLLKPTDKNAIEEHKIKQLRELAKINGTLPECDICSLCGLKGHNQYECPDKSIILKYNQKIK